MLSQKKQKNMFLLQKKQQLRIYVFEHIGALHVFPLPLSLSGKDGQTNRGTNESWANKRGSAPGLVLRLRGSDLF